MMAITPVFDMVAEVYQRQRQFGTTPEALLVHPCIKSKLEAAIQVSGGQTDNETTSRPLGPMGIKVFASPKVDRDVFYAGTVEQIVKYLKELEAV